MRMRLGPSLTQALLILLLLALGGTSALAAGLLADPDRTRLGANEAFTLRLIAEGQPKDEPDLSPLEADFEILSRSKSSRTTIVNGDKSQSQEWVLELAPRRVGDLMIPSLALGDERSQPVPIQVVPADQMEPGDGPRPLFLDTEVDSRSPYVQEPFGYRVKVYYRKPLLRASLSDPKVDGATIEQRGDDHSYRQVLDGEQYTVVERRYLVVPQRSGPLTIQSPHLEAVLVGVTRSNSRPRGQRSPLADLEEMLGGGIFNGMPGMSDNTGARRVVERGPDVTLEVRPQPAGTTGPWLPAQSIQLADQWSPSPPRLRVGEPATRTLTITAQGTTAAQLPTLGAGAADGVKIYPEPPSTEDLPGSGPPSAVKTLKLALVPTRDGPLTLPEIRLHWWDTVEDRERVSVIPSRILQVEPAAGTVATAEDGSKGAEMPYPEARGPAASATDSAPPSSDAPGPSGDLPQSRPPVGLWPWLSLLLGLGWLATLGWMLWRHRRRGAPTGVRLARAEAAVRARSIRSALNAARRAWVEGDAPGAREALLAWGRARWPEHPPIGLAGLAERLGGGEATSLLSALDRAIYAPARGGEANGWDGKDAWASIEPLLTGEGPLERKRAAASLPPLYPQGL